ncbi:MAG: RNA polymerase sigma factor [Ruminiclostridium sp.]
MEDKMLIIGIKKNDEECFKMLIDKYSNYVSVIICNIAGGTMTTQDIEELAADVFVAIWNKAEKIDNRYGNIKPYIGAMARNITKSRLRTLKVLPVSLDDDVIIASVDDVQKKAIESEQKEIINQFVETFSQLDREIFIRYYFLYEKIKKISQHLNVNEATVKTKLSRCREKLKKCLNERGYECET